MIPETLINSYININNDKIASVYVFRKYNDMKEEIKNTIGCKKKTAVQVSEELNKKYWFLVSNCTVSSEKKLKLIKNQGTSGLLRKLGIKTPSSNIPLTGDIFF